MDELEPEGWYIRQRTLMRQFDPRMSPPDTYLLCELYWGEHGRPWTHWVRNNDDYDDDDDDDDDDFHAEAYFLKRIFRPRRPNTNIDCYITWYLSWSPCARCCYKIRNFLRQHPYVLMDIKVARLYYINVESNRKALRILNRLPQVTIEVMEIPDYRYCLENFVEEEAYDDFWSLNFQPKIINNRLELSDVLEGRYW